MSESSIDRRERSIRTPWSDRRRRIRRGTTVRRTRVTRRNKTTRTKRREEQPRRNYGNDTDLISFEQVEQQNPTQSLDFSDIFQDT